MAILKRPLFSLHAKGQIGKTQIYQEYNQEAYSRAYGKPDWTEHPPTAAQLAIQALTKELMKNWAYVSPAHRATWNELAVPASVSRLNSYLKENYRRVRCGQYPIDGLPQEFANLPCTVTQLNPAEDYEEGGAEILITGTRLLLVTTVLFGETPPEFFNVTSDTEITCNAPAGQGQCHVTVENANHTSPETTANVFDWIIPP